MARQLVLLFLSLSSVVLGHQKDLRVEFDGSTHNIYLDGEKWLTTSGVLRVRNSGVTWSTEELDSRGQRNNYILREDSPQGQTISGSDSIGSYTGVKHQWKPAETTSVPVIETSVLTYQDIPVVSYDIEYSSGLGNSFYNDGDLMTVSTFPSFVVKDDILEKRGWMTWSGNMASTAKFGTWSEDAIYGSIDGGFPLVVYDAHMKNTVVLSPLTSFMTAAQTSYWSNATGVNETLLTFGPLNSIHSIPAGYRYRTLLVAADNVTSAMQLYGEVLMRHYGKDHSNMRTDFSINYLGYWTDNGACYYYYTGNYTDYEALLVDVKKDADKNELPYQYVQLDSWWYFRDDPSPPGDDGVKNWTAMPAVFPNGIQSLQQRTKWPIVAHNRFWSAHTDYARMYQGEWIIDEAGSLPDSYQFWQDLLSSSKEEWGLITYEQDWLDKQFSLVKELMLDIELGERWLRQMGEAARSHDIRIQYCMPWPRHVLVSVMNPMVTQIRVSDDYTPDSEQWKVGDSTILPHFLGLAVFKDNFRTSTNQPSCKKYGHDEEEYPVLETYVAALTGGPVGPSDMIGSANKTLIMATCMKDGRLLKPTRPIMSLDSTFLQRTFGAKGPGGQMVAAFTEIESYTWYYIMAAELTESYDLSPTELPPSRNTFPATSLDSVAFQYNIATRSVTSVMMFKETAAITVPKCGKTDFQYFGVAPRFNNNGMYLFGELDKFVPVSEQRFLSFDQANDEVYIRLAGVPAEVVYVTVYDGKSPKTVECTIRSDYYTVLSISQSGSKCV